MRSVPFLSTPVPSSVASALPVEVPDCGRGPQDQEPQLSAGAGAEESPHRQQAAADRHAAAEQPGRALVPPQLPAAGGLRRSQEVPSRGVLLPLHRLRQQSSRSPR